MLAMLLEGEGRTADAEKEYQRALSLDPRAAIAANNLACLYLAQNRNLDQALQLAQTALEQMPEEPHVSDTLGWIYVKKNMSGLAIRQLELSAAKVPTDPVFRYHLGMAYLQAGEADKARRALRQALDLKADFDGAVDAKKALTDLGV
jgi:Flp pilus assembly protein TadD